MYREMGKEREREIKRERVGREDIGKRIREREIIKKRKRKRERKKRKSEGEK